MKKENKTIEGCLDMLGEPMLTEDFVAYSMAGHRELFKAQIIGWTKHKVKISRLNEKNEASDYVTLLEHHPTRFIKIPKLMIMRLKMGLDLKKINENTE